MKRLQIQQKLMYKVAVIKKLLTRSCHHKVIKNLFSKKHRKHENQANMIYIKNYQKKNISFFFFFFFFWISSKLVSHERLYLWNFLKLTTCINLSLRKFSKLVIREYSCPRNVKILHYKVLSNYNKISP